MATSGERVRELVEDEAARAEAADPDEGDEAAEEAETTETPPPEGEPPPQPAGPPSGVSEQQAGELDKAYQAYAKRVARIFGGELPPDCPACLGLGFNLGAAEPEPEFRTTDDYKTCDVCAGLGRLSTGSKVPGHDLAQCPMCTGRGYLVKLTGTVAAVPPPPPAPEPEPDVGGAEPRYGTPAWMGTVDPARAV
jgi:hypothetical protein